MDEAEWMPWIPKGFFISIDMAFNSSTKIFEGTTIEFQDENTRATRAQLEQLYEVPKKTLADNIKRLKKDGLIIGAIIRPKSGRPYETYNLDEIISVGMRLRSDRAITFQKWVRDLVKEKLRQQQILSERLWDKEDRYDLIPRWR